VFDVLNRVGLFEITISMVAIGVLVSAFAGRGSSRETRTLRKENHRLRNIVANLMIDNAQIKDTR
jgi:hypothetical protein